MTPDSQPLVHHLWSERFVEGVSYELRDGCKLWLGITNSAGYGLCPKVDGERLAHRASFAAAFGSIPAAHDIHHRCETKACIDPEHLESLTRRAHRTLHGRADSVLTWDDVYEIRRSAKTGGLTVYDIGDAYGLGKSEVWNIIANLKWHDPDYTPGRPTTCVECGEDFVARRSHQKFCSKQHKNLWTGRRTARRARGQNPDGSETRLYPKKAA